MYLGQNETITDSGVMTDAIIHSYEACASNNQALPEALKLRIEQLANQGSHVARNMLALSGIEMYYDGELFVYEGAVFHPPEPRVGGAIYEEWKDENEA